MSDRQGRDPYLSHWADIAARKTIAAKPDASVYTCAAGITPSGQVHIGNFREVITVELVARALSHHDVKVRFIYSWDDFDVFRKVPVDLPQQEMLTANLRKSIADVPDPFGEHDSYASHNIAAFEESLTPLNITPEFIRQHRKYRAGDYAEGIKTALEHTEKIKAILDQHRKTPLADNWLPIAGFCDGCGVDELDFTWEDGYQVDYTCRSCGHTATVDLRKGGNIKLLWRVDWPMRWQYEGVLFEPGGKDHSSAGGSYDTGKEIAVLFGWQAPEYVAYDFIGTKGRGGKISSSSGGVITVSDALEVYEPEMLRWMFASYRPNTEFSISFDADVIKLYEDYDRARRLAHQPDDGGKNDKKRLNARRALHLASLDDTKIEGGTPMPFVPQFRLLSMVLQAFDGDVDRALARFEATGEVTNDTERALFRQRARCVWNWIEGYAPDEFRFRIRTEPVTRSLEGETATGVRRLVDALRDNPDIDEKGLVTHVKGMTEGLEIGTKDIAPVIYDLLIDRPKGPKLTTLVDTMGTERAVALLSPSVP